MEGVVHSLTGAVAKQLWEEYKSSPYVNHHSDEENWVHAEHLVGEYLEYRFVSSDDYEKTLQEHIDDTQRHNPDPFQEVVDDVFELHKLRAMAAA